MVSRSIPRGLRLNSLCFLLFDVLEFDHMPAETAHNSPALWKSLSIKEKRAILRRLVKQVDALPDRALTDARLTISGAT